MRPHERRRSAASLSPRWGVKIRKSVPLRRHIQENPVVDRDARQRVACAAGLGAAGDFFAPNDQKRDLLTKNETTFLRARDRKAQNRAEEAIALRRRRNSSSQQTSTCECDDRLLQGETAAKQLIRLITYNASVPCPWSFAAAASSQ